jgi:hypothetical protein|tara:strand:- start:147 stop:452 length:306 start_codon:yes stop_codon:yes gene_type:complete
MARIELELTAIVYDNSEFACEKYKIVAFVSDWNNDEQVTQAAEKAVNDHMNHSKKLCIGGCTKIFVDKEQVADAIFQNPEADESLFEKAAELFGLEEGTVH